MTALRQRMIEDMQLRNLSTETQRAYLHYITGLARFYQTSPEHLSLEELREYQLYLINERQYSAESVNHFVVSAKFLYNVTLETPWSEDALPRCRVPHKLPVVLSATEVSEFFQHVSTIRYRAALMTAYGAGLRVSEVVALQIGDIDSQRGLIRYDRAKARRISAAILRTVFMDKSIPRTIAATRLSNSLRASAPRGRCRNARVSKSSFSTESIWPNSS